MNTADMDTDHIQPYLPQTSLGEHVMSYVFQPTDMGQNESDCNTMEHPGLTPIPLTVIPVYKHIPGAGKDSN